jgi:hypothetical protein
VTRASKLPASAAFRPPEWDKADAGALQAVGNGTASPEQQTRALRWIMESAGGLYDLSYRPGGTDGERDTCFAEGRRFVGLQIVKLLKINIGALP